MKKNIRHIKQEYFFIKDNKSYRKAIIRFEEIKDVIKGSINHEEKLLLAFSINQYEQKLWDIPELNPIELIKIRVEDFGYKSTGTSTH